MVALGMVVVNEVADDSAQVALRMSRTETVLHYAEGSGSEFRCSIFGRRTFASKRLRTCA
jgi:hypothetical protein